MTVIAMSNIKHGDKDGNITEIEAGAVVEKGDIPAAALKELSEVGAVANATSKAARKRLSSDVEEDTDTEEEVDESHQAEGNTGANNEVNQPS